MILVVTVWLGEQILNFFGVAIPSLEAAGGLIIALVAMSMLYTRKDGIHGSGTQGAEEAGQSIAVKCIRRKNRTIHLAKFRVGPDADRGWRIFR